MRDLSLALRITVDPQGAVVNLRRVTGEVKRLGDEGERTGTRLGATRRGLQSISAELARFRNAVGAYLAFDQVRRAAGQLIQYADTYKLLEARIRAVSGEHAGLQGVMEGLYQVSQQTRSSLEANATLYARLAQATRDLGMGQERLLGVVQAVNRAILVSGASASEARAGLLQFAQAMASGRMQGDEFRSVMENLPGVALMIAEGLQVDIATLRQMSAQGELTAERIIQAIERQKAKMAEMAGDVPLTVGQAWTILENAVTRYVGRANEAHGVTATLAQAIAYLGNDLDEIIGGFVRFAKVAAPLAVGGGLLFSIARACREIAAAERAAAAAAATQTVSGLLGVRQEVSALSSLLPALRAGFSSLGGPLVWITGILAAGAAAWMSWGDDAEDALSRAKRRLQELRRKNEAMARTPERELEEARAHYRSLVQAIEEKEKALARMRRTFSSHALADDETPIGAEYAGLQAELRAVQDEAETYLRIIGELNKKIDQANSRRRQREEEAEIAWTAFLERIEQERVQSAMTSAQKRLVQLDQEEQKEIDKAKRLAQKYHKSQEELEKAITAIHARYEAERSAITRKEQEKRLAEEKRAAELKVRGEEWVAAQIDRYHTEVAQSEEDSLEKRLALVDLWEESQYQALERISRQYNLTIDQENAVIEAVMDAAAQKRAQARRQWVEASQNSAEKSAEAWRHAYERISDFLTDWITGNKIDLANFFDWIKGSLAQLFATRVVAGAAVSLGLPGAQAWARSLGVDVAASSAQGGDGFSVSSLFSAGAWGGLQNSAAWGVQGLAEMTGWDSLSSLAFGLDAMPSWAFGGLAGGIGGLVTGLMTGDWTRGITQGVLGGIGGAIGGPIGALIGSVVGGFVSKLFRDDKPDNSWFYLMSGDGPDMASATSPFGSFYIPEKGPYNDIGYDGRDAQQKFAQYVVDLVSQLDQQLAAAMDDALEDTFARGLPDELRSGTWRTDSKEEAERVVTQLLVDRYRPAFEAIDSALGGLFEHISSTDDLTQALSTAAEIVNISTQIPDFWRRWHEQLEQGLTEAEAAKKLQDQYNWVAQLLLQPLSDALKGGLAGGDFASLLGGDVEAAVKGLVGDTLMNQFAQVLLKDVMAVAFDSGSALQQALSAFASGEGSLADVQAAVDEFLASVDAGLSEANPRFQELVGVLKDLGLVVDDTTRTIQAGLDRIKTIREKLGVYQPEVMTPELFASQWDLQALGLDPSIFASATALDEWLSSLSSQEQLEAFAEQLESAGSSLDDFLGAVDKLADYLRSVAEQQDTLAVATDQLNTEQRTYGDILRAQIEETKRNIDQMKQLREILSDYLTQLLGTAQGRTVGERYSALYGAWARVLQQTKSSDGAVAVEAMRQLPQVSNQLLEVAAKALSWEEYRALTAQVIAAVQTTIDVVPAQIKRQEEHIEALKLRLSTWEQEQAARARDAARARQAREAAQASAGSGTAPAGDSWTAMDWYLRGAPPGTTWTPMDWYLRGAPPAYAEGGLHSGGLRLVGEEGPELEVTGPARYWSAEQTRDMLARALSRPVPSDSAGMTALAAEIRALRDDLRSTNGMAARDRRKILKLIEKFDFDGLPPTRAVA